MSPARATLPLCEVIGLVLELSLPADYYALLRAATHRLPSCSPASSHIACLEYARMQVALQQGTISTSQARLLFRSARQTSLSANKTAVLSNSPCTSATTASHEFVVLNYNDTIPDTARERSLGLTNRVIAGMLLHSTRSTPVDCKDSRFDNLDNVCSGGGCLLGLHHGHELHKMAHHICKPAQSAMPGKTCTSEAIAWQHVACSEAGQHHECLSR